MKNLITTLDFAAQEKALVMELEILQLSGESHWKLYFFFPLASFGLQGKSKPNPVREAS